MEYTYDMNIQFPNRISRAQSLQCAFTWAHIKKNVTF